jgi:hypothetical protein
MIAKLVDSWIEGYGSPTNSISICNGSHNGSHPLLKEHLPDFIRLAHQCPFEDVREFFRQICTHIAIIIFQCHIVSTTTYLVSNTDNLNILFIMIRIQIVYQCQQNSFCGVFSITCLQFCRFLFVCCNGSHNGSHPLLKEHLPDFIRLAHQCPFEDVREFFTNTLADIQVR